jgi:hypothetical protein
MKYKKWSLEEKLEFYLFRRMGVVETENTVLVLSTIARNTTARKAGLKSDIREELKQAEKKRILHGY